MYQHIRVGLYLLTLSQVVKHNLIVLQEYNYCIRVMKILLKNLNNFLRNMILK